MHSLRIFTALLTPTLLSRLLDPPSVLLCSILLSSPSQARPGLLGWTFIFMPSRDSPPTLVPSMHLPPEPANSVMMKWPPSSPLKQFLKRRQCNSLGSVGTIWAPKNRVAYHVIWTVWFQLIRGCCCWRAHVHNVYPLTYISCQVGMKKHIQILLLAFIPSWLCLHTLHSLDLLLQDHGTKDPETLPQSCQVTSH